MAALDNIHVVDFGRNIAGTVTGMLLADLGAQVTRIEPPAVDRPWPWWERGKRSIALDLDDPDGRRIAAQLASRADVMIDDLGPGVLDDLGLGQEAIRAENPGLVHVAIPVYAPGDQRSVRTSRHGSANLMPRDHLSDRDVLAALDGFRPPAPVPEAALAHLRRPEDRPGQLVQPAVPLASMTAALLAASYTIAAVRVREQTGLGQGVEVPLFEALTQLAATDATTKLPLRLAPRPLTTPWNRAYRTADDRFLQLSCINPTQAETLATLIGRPELIDQGLTAIEPPDGTAHHRLTEVLAEAVAQDTVEKWEQLLVDNEIPGGRCRSTTEWLSHPQAIDGGFRTDAGPGRPIQVAPVVSLSAVAAPDGSDDSGIDAVDGAGTADSRPIAKIPGLDDDRKAILRTIVGPEPVGEAEPITPGWISPVDGPLAGIRVLELGYLLAGATCGRMLADLGAEVLAVVDAEARHHQPHRAHTDRGKTPVPLDLTDPETAEVIKGLAQRVDVVIESFRPGVVEDFGIDADTLGQHNPNLVYASITAFGSQGPWAELPGYDTSVQAVTGLQVGQGGPESPSPLPYTGTLATMTGQSATLGIMAALHRRARDGRGGLVTTDLARIAGYLQAGLINTGPDDDDDGRGPRFTTDVPTWLQDAMSDPSLAARGVVEVVADPDGEGMIRRVGPGNWLSKSAVGTRAVAGAAKGPAGDDPVAALIEAARPGLDRPDAHFRDL